MRSTRFAAAATAVLAASVGAQAQTTLPTITVTTPSPITGSRPATSTAGPGPAATATGEATAPASSPPVIPAGTLLVVDTSFVPVTIVTASDLAAQPGATLTEALQTKPGIAGTTFAPGANRPVIRGLDTYRIRTQENGIGTHDVAALSEDHGVPVDPYSADSVEVVRGPAILRYGSQAIGGVVSVINNRIPEAIPRNGATGEVRGGWTSVDGGRDGGMKVTAGAGGVAVHADAYARSADDYRTPRGRELNSFVDSRGFSVGSSLVGPDGFVGIAFTRFESVYGIPGGEAALEGKRIDMVQDKLTAKGEWRVRDYGIEALRFWFGATRYDHDELDGAGDVGSRFKNREQEGRVELQHMAFQTPLGEMRGAVGVQLGRRNLSTESFEGDNLIDPTRTRSIAAFLFEELQVTRQLKLQGAVRIEDTRVDGRGLSEITDINAPVVFEGERKFAPASASLGLLYTLPMGVVARLTGQYVERAPDAGELFSKGLHEATGTFEIGNPLLQKERAATAEIGLKKATGALRFDASAFYSRYDGFIFKRLTGITCEDAVATCTGGPGELELKQLVFDQRDATFRGVELAAHYDVAPVWNGVWGIEGQYDFVRATFDDAGGNVPRIPPHRIGAGVYYRDANWFARVFALHAFDQTKIAAEETATDGYTNLTADLAYTFKLGSGIAMNPTFTLGLKGENLLDEDMRNHVSFKKDEVLQPGRTVRLYGVLRF